jgi:hypothetical protein
MAKITEILTRLPEASEPRLLPAEFKPKTITPVIQGYYDKHHPTDGYFVGSESRDNTAFYIGDPVVITGAVQFQGKTGDIKEIGRDGSFVVVDLYNYGPQSFQTSDVSYNDHADSEDEQEGSLNEFAPGDGDDEESPLDDYPCYDCGSTIYMHHTQLCDLAEPDAVRDLPAEPGTQHWTGRVPKGLTPIPGLGKGMAENYSDSGAYYNARSAGEYGRSDISASGQPEPGYGASAGDNRTPKQRQQAKYKIPADPFGRTRGKAPQGQPGRVITRATPDEQAADRKQKAYEIISKINASNISDTEKRAARRAVLKKYSITESATTEDLVSAVKTKLGDYLQDVATAIKKDPDLLSKQSQGDSDIKTVKTITTDDGHEIKIHGNEDDGFRISIKDQKLKTQFDNLDEAAMAAEMYCSRRRQALEQQTNRDYLDEQ